MSTTKREPGQKVKAEKDPDLARALRLSLQQCAKVKSEKPSNVKAEQRVGVKSEPSTSVKAEQSARVKAEPGAAASASIRQLPTLRAKIEQLRQVGAAKIKAELMRQEQPSSSGVAGLVARGLEMRSKQQNVKREKGTRGKIKNLVKVKREKGTRRKKPRASAKKRKSSREVMAREIALSDELSEVLGADALSRPEAVRRLWAYCRENEMLNPENRREIIFSTKLEQMMGQPTASMPQLISLLMPHFDYTKAVVKQEAKQEPGIWRPKIEIKTETKKEQLLTAKRETKQERPVTKREQDSTRATKREQVEPSAGSKRAKNEPASEVLDADAKAAAIDALEKMVPQISNFDHTSAVVGCSAPAGRFQLEVVAAPTDSASSASELRAPCKVEFREDGDGAFEPHAEARLIGLDPKLGYHVTVQICGGGGGCSHEVLLPQRACPAKWSPRDVKAWCQAQHVPELVRMTQDYAIDGSTLLSLSEQDLKASGVVAPFLLRRTLAGLAALRAAGT